MGNWNTALDLKKLRNEIDQLDAQIAIALNKRAALVEEVWLLKQHNQLPLIDPTRENAIFSKVRSICQGPLSEDSMQKIFRCILSEARPKIKNITSNQG